MDYDADLTLGDGADQLLTPEGRAELAAGIREALGHQERFTEHVVVSIQLGRI